MERPIMRNALSFRTEVQLHSRSSEDSAFLQMNLQESVFCSKFLRKCMARFFQKLPFSCLQPALCSQHLFLRNEKYNQHGKTALEPILPVERLPQHWDSQTHHHPKPPRGKIYPFRQCLEAPKSKVNSFLFLSFRICCQEHPTRPWQVQSWPSSPVKTFLSEIFQKCKK